MNIRQEQILKQKTVKGLEFLIIKLNDHLVLVLCQQNNKIIKERTFILSNNKNQNKEIMKRARNQYKMWISIKYKLGYLTDDDTDIIAYKALDKNKKVC